MVHNIKTRKKIFGHLSPLQRKKNTFPRIYEIFRDYYAENGDHGENTIRRNCSYRENLIHTSGRKNAANLCNFDNGKRQFTNLPATVIYKLHETVWIWSFFWSSFSSICSYSFSNICSYSVPTRENTDQKKLRIQTFFSRNDNNNEVTLNPFVPNASVLYPLKTPENNKVSDVFKGRKKVHCKQGLTVSFTYSKLTKRIVLQTNKKTLWSNTLTP